MRALITLATILGVSACTWVDVNEGAQNVAIVDELPASCERVGTTDVRTQTDIGFIDRDREVVETELQTLARNAAVRKGGNTLVAETDISTEGEQRFGLYRCP